LAKSDLFLNDTEDSEPLDGNVEDDASESEEGAPQFTINSYGADYTVDSLVKRMRTNAFQIPDFQRKYVWSLPHASQFIESLLMGLPVPGIFLYRQPDTNQHLVIDGQQRLKTLQAFYDGAFDKGGPDERPFTLVGVRRPWIGKNYDGLEQHDQLKLDDSVVHATIFQQEEPREVLDSIFFVFQRINSGGMRLSAQEIRNAVSQGTLLTMIKELNDLKAWRSIFGSKNRHLKDQELILRFFALLENAEKYARPMTKFLNDYASSHKNLNAGTVTGLASIFTDTIELLNAEVGKDCFRLVRAFNAAAFDGVTVGLARRLIQNGAPQKGHVALAYRKLLQNTAFRAACERATADEESVARRLALATEAFA